MSAQKTLLAAMLAVSLFGDDDDEEEEMMDIDDDPFAIEYSPFSYLDESEDEFNAWCNGEI